MTSAWVFTHWVHVLTQWYLVTNVFVEAIFPKKTELQSNEKSQKLQNHTLVLYNYFTVFLLSNEKLVSITIISYLEFLSASTEMTVFLFLYFLTFCGAENKATGIEM